MPLFNPFERVMMLERVAEGNIVVQPSNVE